MVRKSHPKPKNYSEDDLANAVISVKEGQMNPTQASKHYGIPRQTIINHVNGRYKNTKIGRPTILTIKEEEELVSLIEKMSEWGFGLNRNSLHFKNRWSSRLFLRVSQNITINRAAALNKSVLSDFYDKLESKIKDLGLENKPSNIFNADESGFICNPGLQKVFSRKGANEVLNLSVNNDKEMIFQIFFFIVLDFSGNYRSRYYPSVFYQRNLWSTWCKGGPLNCKVRLMETIVFLNWFRNVFVESSKHLDGAKLLILDGHSSHVSIDLINIARENNQTIDKAIFPSLLNEVTKSAFKRAHAVAGFETIGIFPFNRDAIHKDKLLVSETFEEESLISSESQNGPANGAVSCINSVSDLAQKAHLNDEPNLIDTPRNDGSSSVSVKESAENAVLNFSKETFSQNKKRKKLKRDYAQSLTEDDPRNSSKNSWLTCESCTSWSCYNCLPIENKKR
ncbi:tigger transposable element-derived 2-like [Brachionus plicatilis]|uniref:Tigger transposable element-derived 2-like n=1 Tax=Brachionus plicatilis TaxID=10195 RepID=A0A3M7RBA0_BRAPC|nr:tigger transposable element-derived 2-like [Brachionus plicatilis]